MTDYSSRQSLSSTLTIINKFVFPAAFIGGFGFVTIVLLINKSNQLCGFVSALFVVSIICLGFLLPLKYVEIDENYLYVSNYFKTIQVPFSQIKRVNEAPFINIHPVTITFKEPTEFGEQIWFMPYYQLGSIVMMSHPVVEKLRRLAGLGESRNG